jgi:hypothetical protein
VPALAGLRWGELAGLQVDDLVSGCAVPWPAVVPVIGLIRIMPAQEHFPWARSASDR